MKIGIDARFFGPESKGLGRYTQKLIQHLEKIDHENDYVIFLMKENYHAYHPKNKRFQKVCADYRWYTLREQVFFPRLIKKHDCAIVHFPHFNVPLLYNKPFLVTIHDLILLRFPTRKASTHGWLVYWFKFLMYRIVIWHAIHKARHIIAVSAFTKKDILKQYHVAEKKITVTYEAGLEHKPLAPATALARCKKLGLGGNYFLYVGNAYPHKNVSMLVKAFAQWKTSTSKQLRDRKLVLVGRDDYFYKKLSRLIAKKAIKDIVILHTVDDKTLTALYQNAEIFVFPSLCEGFGLPPLEALAYGTPVLSSRSACMPEILGDAVSYADMSSQHEIVKALNTMITNPAIYKQRAQYGKRYVKRYSWERMSRQTHAIYQKVLSML